MKKFFLLVPVAALAMTACTSESNEFVGDKQQAREIKFSPLAQPNTRGANAILNTTFPTDNTMEVACYQSAPATASNYFKRLLSFMTIWVVYQINQQVTGPALLPSTGL